MKKITKKIIALFLIVTMALSTNVLEVRAASSSIVSLKIRGTCNYKKSYEVLKIINKERKKKGLKALSMDKDLLDAAVTRSSEIALYYSHTRANGSECFTVDRKVMGENIAAGSAPGGFDYTSKEVMEQWMNSPGHRRNILDKNYKCVGVACFETEESTFWVQLFGTNKAKPISKKSNKTIKPNVKIKRKLAIINQENTETITVSKGKSAKLSMYLENTQMSLTFVNIEPDSFKFSTSNKKVVTVSKKGKIKGMSKGKATITAKYKGTNKVACKWKIKVI